MSVVRHIGCISRRHLTSGSASIRSRAPTLASLSRQPSLWKPPQCSQRLQRAPFSTSKRAQHFLAGDSPGSHDMAQTQKPNDGAQFRLSKDFTPTHYALIIKTDLEAKPEPTFEGTVEIDLDVHAETDSVTFHAASPLKITYATISSTSLKTSQQEESKDISMDEKLERATVKFQFKLSSGSKAKLGLRFEGVLEGSMMGYYKSTYEHEGKKGVYGLTQFEPTAARRAFPCWDEPAIKATYQVSLIARKGTVALANTSAVSTVPSNGYLPATPLVPAAEKGPGKGPEKGPEKGPDKSGEKGLSAAESEWYLTKFEPTPKVSTYLVTWANGPFEHREVTMKSPLTGKTIPLRTYGTADVIDQTVLCLEASQQLIPLYEKLFDIPYPLSKLDTLVAHDFDAGAMEGWGLITCRTSVGLYDAKQSGLAAKKWVISVEAHECAHQWFGNIVTMEWWEELWLNEAFATLMGEVISIQELYPEWRVHADFINSHLGRALSLDARRSSHPIQVPCPDPEQINQIFDAISYSKGASVLKMLSNLVGEQAFLKGVSIYLKNHLYGNGTTADLWAGISQSTGLDVAKIMDAWTLKIGFPVITVEETSDGLKLRQNRFLSTGDPTPEEDGTIWYVPLQVKTIGSDGKPTVKSDAILDTRETTLPFPGASGATYKLNAETCGVYRVRYPAERLVKLGAEAAKGERSAFTTADRMGLVQDAYVLASSGYSETSTALDFVSQLAQEPEHLVWGEIIACVGAVSNTWWENDKVSAGLQKLEQSLYGPWANTLGLDVGKDESEDRIELRQKIIAAAASAEHPETLDDIKRRLALFVDQNDDSLINGDLRSTIYKNGVKFGGSKEYEKMLEVYRKPPTPQHKISAIAGLCATRDQKLLKRTFDFVLGGEVKEQDFMYFFRGLSANRKSRRELWDFTTKNLDELVRRFKGNFSLGRLIQDSFSSFTTKEDVKTVEEFYKDKDTSTYRNSLAQGLDTVRANAAWLKRDDQNVTSWLKTSSFL